MKSIIIIGISAILIYSCRRETSPPLNGLLSQYPKIKSMQLIWMGIFAGDVDNIDFSYDNSGRVTSMKAYNAHLSSGAPFYDSIFNLNFEYNDTKNLPWRVSCFNYINTINEIHYIQYNASNQPVTDSVIGLSTSGQGLERFSVYTYSGNSIVGEDRYGTGNIVFFDYVNFYVNNGNFYSWGWGQPPTYSEYYDFDSGKNLLNNLNIAPVFFILGFNRKPLNDLWSIWGLSSKNNVIRIKTYFNPSTGLASDTSFLYNYYDPNGLLQKRYWCEEYLNSTGTYVDTVDMIKFIYQ